MAEHERLLRRLRIFYFLTYGALGWMFPQIPVFIERLVGNHGVGLVMVTYPLVGLLAAPFWGFAADQHRMRVRLLSISTLLMAPTVLLFGLSDRLIGLVMITALFALFRAPHAALADALSHAALEGRHHLFSRFRLYGSVGFVALAALSGAVDSVSLGWVYLAVPALCYLAGGLSFVGIGEPSSAPRPGTHDPGIRAVLTQPAIVITLAGMLVYYSGHGLFDAYFSLHMTAIGLPAGHASVAWSFGALVEIGVMAWAPALLSRLAARRWLVVAAMVASIRWALTAAFTNATALILVQGLHGITFGLWYLATVNHIQAATPAGLRASSQSVAMSAFSAAQVLGYGLGGWLIHAGTPVTLYHWATALACVAACIYAVVPPAAKHA